MTRSRKASLRLRGGERISVLGSAQSAAPAGDGGRIPLDIVYEDADLAVVNKPAGMTVHAGAGATEDERNRGTLVNALLHHFGQLSSVGGELRPGIVHRLDKATSGLMVVAKSDEAHRRLASQFVRRQVKKKYIALVHGWLKQDRGTISSSISRDRVRRTRMTTLRSGGREAITHYTVQRRLDSPYGKFTLLEVQDRHRPHAPDSRAPGIAGPSGGGGHAVRRPARASSNKADRHVAFSCQKFSARRGVAVPASAELASRCLSRPRCPRNWRISCRSSAGRDRAGLHGFAVCFALLGASYLLATARRPRDSSGMPRHELQHLQHLRGFRRLYN